MCKFIKELTVSLETKEKLISSIQINESTENDEAFYEDYSPE